MAKLLIKKIIKIFSLHNVQDCCPCFRKWFKSSGDTHQKVIENNDKFHGVTIHFVNNELDAGKVIAQGKLKVEKSENIAKLIERIHKIEHDLLPYIVNKFATLEIEKQNEIYYKTYNF